MSKFIAVYSATHETHLVNIADILVATITNVGVAPDWRPRVTLLMRGEDMPTLEDVYIVPWSQFQASQKLSNLKLHQFFEALDTVRL